MLDSLEGVAQVRHGSNIQLLPYSLVYGYYSSAWIHRSVNAVAVFLSRAGYGVRRWRCVTAGRGDVTGKGGLLVVAGPGRSRRRRDGQAAAVGGQPTDRVVASRYGQVG
jgi:hypothetical protein